MVRPERMNRSRRYLAARQSHADYCFRGRARPKAGLTWRNVMIRGSKKIAVAGLAALALLGTVAGTSSAASAATWRGHHYVYARYYHHWRHYGWRRHYAWRRHYYYGPGPVIGGILGGLAAGLVAGPYYYGAPYGYYGYGPGPYYGWW